MVGFQHNELMEVTKMVNSRKGWFIRIAVVLLVGMFVAGAYAFWLRYQRAPEVIPAPVFFVLPPREVSVNETPVPVQAKYIAVNEVFLANDAKDVVMMARLDSVYKSGNKVKARMTFFNIKQVAKQLTLLLHDQSLSGSSFALGVQRTATMFPISDEVNTRILGGDELLGTLQQYVGTVVKLSLFIDERPNGRESEWFDFARTRFGCNKSLYDWMIGGDFKACEPYIIQMNVYEN